MTLVRTPEVILDIHPAESSSVMSSVNPGILPRYDPRGSLTDIKSDETSFVMFERPQ